MIYDTERNCAVLSPAEKTASGSAPWHLTASLDPDGGQFAAGQKRQGRCSSHDASRHAHHHVQFECSPKAPAAAPQLRTSRAVQAKRVAAWT